MKKILLLACILLSSPYLFAQYFKSDFTVGGGATFLYGDGALFGDSSMSEPKASPALFLRYSISPQSWFSIGIDIQGGLLQSQKQNLVENPDQPYSSNRYVSGTVDFRLKPFRLFYDCDDRFQQNTSTILLKSIYLGVGIGGIVNNVDFKGGAVIPTDEQTDPNTAGLIFPVNFGLDIPLQKQNRTAKKAYFLNLNSQLNFSNSDWLDGRNADVGANERNDFYSFFSLGFVMKLR